MFNHEDKNSKKAGINQEINDSSKKEVGYRPPLTFIKSEVIGKCPCCDDNVNNNQLYVEEEEIIYHFSCYNIKKSKEKSD